MRRLCAVLVLVLAILSGCSEPEARPGEDVDPEPNVVKESPSESLAPVSEYPPCEKTGLSGKDHKIKMTECAVGYAAIAEEMYRNENSVYTDDTNALLGIFLRAGGNLPEEVVLNAYLEEGERYCVEGVHRDLDPKDTLHFRPPSGTIEQGPC